MSALDYLIEVLGPFVALLFLNIILALIAVAIGA